MEKALFLDKLHNLFTANDMPFLAKQREYALKFKPYKKLAILQNVPLTLSTLFKIEVLVLGGAEVFSYLSSSLPYDDKAIDLLLQANYRVVSKDNCTGDFDFHLDCCAELLHLAPPKLGAVELTQSGSKIYEKAQVDYPVISVDYSKLKVL